MEIVAELVQVGKTLKLKEEGYIDGSLAFNILFDGKSQGFVVFSEDQLHSADVLVAGGGHIHEELYVRSRSGETAIRLFLKVTESEGQE